MSDLIDISQTLRNGLPVWPGDTEYQAERTWQLDDNCPVNVSRIQLSTHSGAHADAPLHYDNDGLSIDEVDPAIYIGPCQVIHLERRTGQQRIEVADCQQWVKADVPSVARILFRTYPSFPHQEWDSHYWPISAEAIDWLANVGTSLIGLDSPSLDPQESKTLDAHMAVRRHRMAILEGLVLDQVTPGEYELIAPPLKLAGMDASPVRALLRRLP